MFVIIGCCMRLIFTILMAAIALDCCARTIYHEDFGGNSPDDARVYGEVYDECKYDQMFSDDDGSHTCSFSLRKEGYFNGVGMSQWHIQCDKTYPDDYSRGYYLHVDGGLQRDIFFVKNIKGNFRPGDRLRISLWVANVYTCWQKREYLKRNGVRAQDPDFFVVLRDAWNVEISRHRVGPVPTDNSLCGKTDYECSSQWHLYEFEYEVKRAETEVVFQLENAGFHSPGNDFGIDEIKIDHIK